MNILTGQTSLDQIEATCKLLEPQAGRPHLVVMLSIQDRSPGRQREIYLPMQCNFSYLAEDGSIVVIGPATDLTGYAANALGDTTIPRGQTMTLVHGVRLDPLTLAGISTIVRRMNTVTLLVGFVAPLLNDVRTVNQRMFAFTPSFKFSLDLETWNDWLSRWKEKYLPSDLPATIPEEVAIDYAEGVRCLGVEAFKACVVMLRRSLESAAIKKGGVGTSLLAILDTLVEKRVLSKADHALASGVRMFGNYGAHPSTDQLSLVSRDDAELVLVVTRQLLKTLFV